MPGHARACRRVQQACSCGPCMRPASRCGRWDTPCRGLQARAGSTGAGFRDTLTGCVIPSEGQKPRRIRPAARRRTAARAWTARGCCGRRAARARPARPPSGSASSRAAWTRSASWVRARRGAAQAPRTVRPPQCALTCAERGGSAALRSGRRHDTRALERAPEHVLEQAASRDTPLGVAALRWGRCTPPHPMMAQAPWRPGRSPGA